MQPFILFCFILFSVHNLRRLFTDHVWEYTTKQRGELYEISAYSDLRTDADMSQKQLSEILHISQRSYSHYETGSRNIPVEMLIRLANYYDISVDYLVGRTDKKEMNK